MAGILEWMAADDAGETAQPLTVDELGAELRKLLTAQPEVERKDAARRRHLLYKSGGCDDMAQLVADVFTDREVIEKRHRWVDKARFNNVLKRVVNELSTVYTKPAKRTVSGVVDNARYQVLQQLCKQDAVFKRINRWLNLHHTILVGFRVRVRPDGTREPVIDVLPPSQFTVVASPADSTMMVGVIIEQSSSGARTKGKYRLWTDAEKVLLTAEGRIVSESWNAHGFPRMPWILLSLEPPAGELVESTEGEDLVAAHRAVWFENICLLKESKSATKQPVLTGDTTQMARGQAADSEVPIEAPDGVVVNTVDLSMDLDIFMSTAKNIYETAAANKGVPPMMLNHQGVQSAEARELMLAPLKLLRMEQEVPLRDFERSFVEVQSMVCAVDLPDLAFSTEGWALDFGDATTALDPETRLRIFETRRRLGLTNTIEFLLEENPDLTEEAAWLELATNVEVELQRNELMRPLQQVSGSLGASTPGTENPQSNPKEAPPISSKRTGEEAPADPKEQAA